MIRVRHKTLFDTFPGKLTIVFGNLKSGKSTSIMVDAIANAANRKKVLFISYDKSKKELDEFFSNYSLSLKDYLYPFNNFVIDDDAGTKFIQLLLKITNSDADIVYIDYIAAVKFTNGKCDVGFTIKELERCARITGKAIVITDLLNRDPFTEEDLYNPPKWYKKVVDIDKGHYLYAISGKRVSSTIYQYIDNEFQIIKKNFRASDYYDKAEMQKRIYENIYWRHNFE